MELQFNPVILGPSQELVARKNPGLTLHFHTQALVYTPKTASVTEVTRERGMCSGGSATHHFSKPVCHAAFPWNEVLSVQILIWGEKAGDE